MVAVLQMLPFLLFCRERVFGRYVQSFLSLRWFRANRLPCRAYREGSCTEKANDTKLASFRSVFTRRNVVSILWQSEHPGAPFYSLTMPSYTNPSSILNTNHFHQPGTHLPLKQLNVGSYSCARTYRFVTAK